MGDSGDALAGNPAFLSIGVKPLAILTALLAPAQMLGKTPAGNRKIAPVLGGTFIGPDISGKILPFGGDWALTRADGVLTLNVRLTIETDDGALVHCSYSGMRHGPPEVIGRLARGEAVDPAEMYFRIAPKFETAAPRYDWLNRILAIGTGERLANGPRYSIYQVL